MASPATSFRTFRRLTDAGPTPFTSGQGFSEAAAVAKLTSAILAGAQDRAMLEEYKKRSASDAEYRGLQMKLLQQRLADASAPKPQGDPYSIDLPAAAPGAVEPGEVGPQVEHPNVTLSGRFGEAGTGSLSQDQYASIAARVGKAAEPTPEKGWTPQQLWAKDLAERKFALTKKRSEHDASLRADANANITQINAQQQREEIGLGDQIRTAVNQALADLKTTQGRERRAYGMVSGARERMTPQEFLGVRWNPAARGYIDANGKALGQADLDRLREAIVARKMSRHRLALENVFGPKRAKYQKVIEGLVPMSEEDGGADYEFDANGRLLPAGP